MEGTKMKIMPEDGFQIMRDNLNGDMNMIVALLEEHEKQILEVSKALENLYKHLEKENEDA